MWPIRCSDRGREKRPLASGQPDSRAAFSSWFLCDGAVGDFVNDLVNSLRPDGESFRQRALAVGVCECANFSDGIRRQRPQHSASPQFSADAAALCAHVAHVVGIRAEKQMRWIAARAVIAGVANHYPGHNGALRQFPRDPMSTQCPPYPVLAYRESAVAISKKTGQPRPAVRAVAALDSFPESFRGSIAKCHQVPLCRQLYCD